MNTPPSFPLTIFYPYTTFEYISLESVSSQSPEHDNVRGEQYYQ